VRHKTWQENKTQTSKANQGQPRRRTSGGWFAANRDAVLALVVKPNRLAVFAELDHGNFDRNRGTSSGREAAEYKKGSNMNGYEKAVELGLSGTAAEQVAILQTLTVSDINVKAVQR
jgi:hypothetical protein